MAVTGWVSLGYGLWRDGLPGAGLYPAVIAFLCAACAGVEAVRTQKGYNSEAEAPAGADDEAPEWSVHGIVWSKLAIYAVSFVVLVLTFDFLGFFVSSGTATLIILLFAERVGIAKAAFVTAALLFASYAIFEILLGVHFPAPAIAQFWNP